MSNGHEFGVLITLEASEPSRATSRRLRQVVSVRASIRHPNLVRACPLGQADGRLFVGLEQLPYPTLAERFAAAPLERAECVRILDGVAAGADALQRLGLVPRDITPDKVLAHPADGGVLMDLGIPPELLRRATSGRDPQPESQPAQEESLDASDTRECVYSLGAVLFTALTGVQPSVGAENGRSTRPVRKPPLPSERRADLTPEIDEVVARAMATDRAERYADMRELSRAAVTALGLNGVPVRTPSNGNPGARRLPSRDRGSATAAQSNGGHPVSIPATEAPQAPRRSRQRSTLSPARQRPSSPPPQARSKPKASEARAAATHACRALAGWAQSCVEVVVALVAVAVAARGRLRDRAYRFIRGVPPAARTVGSGIAGVTRRSADAIRAMFSATGRVRGAAARPQPSSSHDETRTRRAPAMLAHARRALAAGGRRCVELAVGIVAVSVAAGDRLRHRVHRLLGGVKPAARRIRSGMGRVTGLSAKVIRPMLAAIGRVGSVAARRCRGLAAGVAHRLQVRVPRRGEVLRHSKPVLVAAGALAACVPLGTAIGRAMDVGEGPLSVARSGMMVRVPSGWEEASVDAGSSAVSRVLAAAPSEESKAGLVVGTVRSQAVAQRLLEAMQLDSHGRAPVRLGSLYGWRYAGLRPRPHLVGSGYVVPTGAGAVMLLCHAARSEAGVRLHECEGAATTLTIRGERPRPLSGLSRSEERLIAVIGTLRSSRSDARRRLAVADRPQGQVRAATALRLSYLRAAQSLDGLPPLENGRRLGGVSGALRDAGAAYGRLADAAESGLGSAYREASHDLIVKEEEIRRELARVSGA
jgi:hypothetical protein